MLINILFRYGKEMSPKYTNRRNKNIRYIIPQTDPHTHKRVYPQTHAYICAYNTIPEKEEG